MSDEQPPAGDQGPLGGSQPPTDPPPPAPVNPYETPAAPVNPYDTPAAPPPPPAAPYAAPQYGTPQYGTPQDAMAQPGQPGQPAMPATNFPAVPVDDSPSKALAIAALVSSLICCTPVGFVLALIVLRKGKDGRNHGRGLAISALVISVVFSVFLGATAYGLSQVDWDEVGESFSQVEQLKTGDCFNSSDLDDGDEVVGQIDEISCDKAHDAEVLLAHDLTQDEAEGYADATEGLCGPLLGTRLATLPADVTVTDLTPDSDPNAGDNLACVAYRPGGPQLGGPLP